jgi:hypothetical protein
MTSVDGTTFIISYEYIDEGNMKDLTNNINSDLKNRVTPPETPPQSSNNDNRQFLEEFLSGRHCLTGGTGWWKYELCYGKHIRQFHVKYFFALTKNRNLVF